MASAVDICNLALSFVGDRANVSSIDPPEGSAQAEHCARWYPIARDRLLSEHNWNFATKRAALALLSSVSISGWSYAYAMPADCMTAIAVIPTDSAGDYLYSTSSPLYPEQYQYDDLTTITPIEFVEETDSDGTRIILTNQENAYLRYTAYVTDTTKFPPLVINALARLLSSYLAGTILKGQTGIKVAQSLLQIYEAVDLPKARVHDSKQRRLRTDLTAPWHRDR